MRRVLLCVACFALLLCSGCSGKARVKGRVVENGQPKEFPATQAALLFVLIGPEGKPDPTKSYTAVINTDGTFEVVASGGELTPGTYQVIFQATGKMGTTYKQFGAPHSAIRREIKSGANELTIDLAKPEG